MITSFYFVMWIAIYFLIFLSGNPTLIDYGFYAAFIGVFLLGRAADSLCRDAIDRRNERDVTAMLEILYTGDKRKLVSVFHKKFLLAAASFIYMAIATIGLLFAHASLIIVGIFALFTFFSGKEVHRANSNYQKLKNSSEIVVGDEMRQALDAYAARRRSVEYKDVAPVVSSGEKALRIFNIVISAVCLLIGLLFIYIFGSVILTYGMHDTYAVINVAYALLAIAYGASDLYTVIKGYNFLILP